MNKTKKKEGEKKKTLHPITKPVIGSIRSGSGGFEGVWPEMRLVDESGEL